MGRWRWAVVLGMVGWLACGTEGPGPEPAVPTPSTDEKLDPAPGDESPPPPVDGQPPPPIDEQPPPPPIDEEPPPPTGPLPDASLPDPARLPAGEFPAVQPRLPTFSLKVAAADLQRLESNPYADDMVPVEVEFDGQRARGVMRYRGASTRDAPQKSYKIELDKGYEFEDRDHFRLLASYNDSGKLTEKFAVDLFTALGLPVPRARYVTVRVNGEHKGVFLDMEHVGKDYVKHHRMEKGASVYRCGGRNCELTLQPGSYQSDFEKKTNEATGREDLDAFLRWVNLSDDAEFEAQLAARVDLEAYLGNMAADILISNAVVEDSRSYWIHELGRDVWTYVPWDLNNARLYFWRTWKPTDPPITNMWPQPFSVYDPFVQTTWETRVAQRPAQRPTWNVLSSRIWQRPALRERVLAKVEAALTTGPFSEARAHAHIDALWQRVGPALQKDPYVSPEHLRRATAFLKQYVRERRAYLQRQLPVLRAGQDGPLVVRELSAGEGGYVELYNRGGEPLALERYSVTNNLRVPLLHRLPAGLVLAPGESLRLVADGSAEPGHLPFTLSSQGGEVGVFDATRTNPKTGQPLMYGPQDAVWFGPQPEGLVYGRKAPESEDFERRPATPPAAP